MKNFTNFACERSEEKLNIIADIANRGLRRGFFGVKAMAKHELFWARQETISENLRRVRFDRAPGCSGNPSSDGRAEPVFTLGGLHILASGNGMESKRS